MKRFLILSVCMVIAHPVLAQVTPQPNPAYAECTALAASNPEAALAKADAWLKIDGSVAAQHCRAMALYGLRRFDEAAAGLAAVRNAIAMDQVGMRSYMARQAAQAWMNANQVDRSLTLLTMQIDEMSSYRNDNAAVAVITSDLLLDRARMNASYGKMNDAVKDLDHAVSLTPLNEMVLFERARLFEKLGDRSLARSDAENVLKLDKNHVGAKEILTRIGVLAPPPINLMAPESPAVVAAPAQVAKKVVKRKKSTAAKAVTPASQAP